MSLQGRKVSKLAQDWRKKQAFDAVTSDPYLGHKIRMMALMEGVVKHVDRPLVFAGGRNRCAATLTAAFERLDVGAMINRSADDFSPTSLEHCLLADSSWRVSIRTCMFSGKPVEIRWHVLDRDNIAGAGSKMIDYARKTLCDNGYRDRTFNMIGHDTVHFSQSDHDLWKRKFAVHEEPEPPEPDDY